MYCVKITGDETTAIDLQLPLVADYTEKLHNDSEYRQRVITDIELEVRYYIKFFVSLWWRVTQSISGS